MNRPTVDLIIPTYKPGKEFPALLKKIAAQTYPVRRIIVRNTEEAYWDSRWEQLVPNLEVHHIRMEDFDHGGTRAEAAACSDADLLFFMTQDAVPADNKLVHNLVKPFSMQSVKASYARQLARPDCRFLEAYTRSFNYPEKSCLKDLGDLPELGIKTFFCSNVCAVYERTAYEELGGFIRRTIFNEDMIFAGQLIQEGYTIAYCADARVYHSHNYTGREQLRRNFDLAVSQADHPEIFGGISSEGEGIRMVISAAKHVCAAGKPWLVAELVYQSGCKYIGYFLGKRYRHLPESAVRRLTMSPLYWEKPKNRNS